MVSNQTTLIFPPRSCQHFSSGLARYDHIQPVTGHYTPTVEVGCLALPTQIPMHSWAPAWPRWVMSSWRYLGYLHDIPSLWYLHDLIYRDKKIEMIWHLCTLIIFRYEVIFSGSAQMLWNFSWRLNIGWFTHDTYTGTMWLDVQIIFWAKLQILQHTSSINCWDRWLALWWCSQTIL